MLRALRPAILRVLRGSGIFQLVANSDWRRQRLLILCYHSVSLEDEHEWRPYLYIHPDKLNERFASLKRGNFSILPLAEGLQRLQAQTLPPRSVSITFDDGTFDFYRQAYPLLKRYQFPATVYQTTYYSSLELPVFNLMCSYLLWKRRTETIASGKTVGLHGPLDLGSEASRFAIVRRLIEGAEGDHLTGAQKDEVVARLADLLHVDYQELKAKRILQLMNGRELLEVAKGGIDLQLHTHRHRTPENESLFRKEIQDNRAALHPFTIAEPVHFCYPSGVYRRTFLSWLRKENVVSATTCDTGLAESGSERLLLPRYVDHQRRKQIEFESWTTGVGNWLAFRRKSVQDSLPNYGADPQISD
ncbi:MAG TPA: polysaccharide deacetylase family protein [Verrucomicrobiae bacterium]|nr:polysaccharide deacetylase family protein [Verrucomicrobiae bacterium]